MARPKDNPSHSGTIHLGQPNGYSCTLTAGAPATGRFSLLLTQQRVLATAPAQLSQQVLAFPPAHAQVSVQLPVSLSSHPVQATLLNTLGQVVRQVTLPAATDAVRTLGLPTLTAGIYTLRLQTTAGQVV